MKKSWIKGLHHVSLKTAGYEEFKKVVDFYQEVLGLTLVRSWGEGNMSCVMLDTGNSLLEIGANGGLRQPQGAIHHLALATDQVDAVVEAVRRAGYEVTMEPTDKTLPTDPPFPIRIAFFIGPCGETVELFCEK